MKNSEYYTFKIEQEYEKPEEQQNHELIEHWSTLKRQHEQSEAMADYYSPVDSDETE